MTQRPDDTRLHDWLDETVGPTPDPVEGTHQVMSQVEETSQAGRWLPFPLLHRKAKAKTRTTEYQPNPIPASNGHTPTVIGRTQSMLSPVKAITAGAIVFAIGGAFLIAQPFQPQGTVPGAATAPGDAAMFTADATLDGPYVQVGCESSDGVRHCRDEFQMAVDATDPRASGTLTYGLNRDTHSFTVNVHAGTVTIENDDGMWAGTFTGYWPQEGGRSFHARLAGQDGYEGWTMLLDDFCECNTPTSVMQGVIIPGDLPSAE
jgi:hypothetical protein